VRRMHRLTGHDVAAKTTARCRAIDRACRLLAAISCLGAFPALAAAADGGAAPAIPVGKESGETIVFFRHGEKPPGGSGQLSCRGLNRALALPAVLVGKFGVPEFLFAPNPSHQIEDAGKQFDYIRPLATIEPTAVMFGLPVNTQWGLQQIGHLRRELLQPRYGQARIFVAWEHFLLAKLVKQLVAAGGADPSLVPEWPPDDFDSIYVVTLQRSQGRLIASFTLDHEGLDGQPTACPR